MVALLVQEGGADIWEELRIHADAFLPLHAAAIMGARPVVDFFLTECGMSINACSSTRQYTVMHQLARSMFNPTEHLSMAA